MVEGNDGRNILDVSLPPHQIIDWSFPPNVLEAIASRGLVNGRNLVPLPAHAILVYQQASGWIRDDEVYEVRGVSGGASLDRLNPRTVVLGVDSLFTRPEFLADVPGQITLASALNADMNNSMVAFADAYRQELESLSPAFENYRPSIREAYQESLSVIPGFARPQHEAIRYFFQLASQTPQVEFSSPVFQEAYHRLQVNLATLSAIEDK